MLLCHDNQIMKIIYDDKQYAHPPLSQVYTKSSYTSSVTNKSVIKILQINVTMQPNLQMLYEGLPEDSKTYWA